MKEKTDIETVFGTPIKENLQMRGLSQKDFAEAVGMRPSHLNEIIRGKRKIPIALVPVFSDLIGINAESIIEIQKQVFVDRSMSKEKSPDELHAEAQLAEFDRVVSVDSLIKGKMPKRSTATDKLDYLRTAYFLEDVEALNSKTRKLSEVCFRRSTKTGLDYRMIFTWVVKAQAIARSITLTNKFDQSRVPELAVKLSSVLHANRDTENRVKALLSEYGIGFLWVEKEARASIDGYSFSYNGTPYIIYTRRFDRIDNFAYTILHELAHIYLGHTNDEVGCINVDCRDHDGNEVPTMENEADRFAAEWLIPNRLWCVAPMVPLNPHVIQKRYSLWAREKGLNPWIVLGRVSHETGMYRFTTGSGRSIHKSKKGEGCTK